MNNCIIKKLKGNIKNDIPTLSSIRLSFVRESSTTFIDFIKSVDSETANTFAKSVDGLIKINGQGQTPSNVTNMGTNNGYLYISSNTGVEYPCVVKLDLYPKWNFEEVRVNYLEDLDASMVNLKKVKMVNYTPSDVSEYVCGGNVEILKDIPSLESVILYSPLNTELVTGDLGKLGTLVNLANFHTHAAGVYGDLKGTLDGMYANGRVSGELVFRSASTKVVLTHGGNTVRIGDSTVTHQATNVYGWRIAFDANGWSVAETYTTYVS